MKSFRLRNYFFLILLLAGLALPLFNVSATSLSGSLLAGVECANYGSQEDCKICDMIQVLVNASNIIIAISGVIALLMFVYAGLLYLTVSAKPDHVKKAKDVLVTTVIGIVLIFGAYTIVNFVLSAFGGTAGMGAYQAAYHQVTGKNDWGVCVQETNTQ